MTDRTETDLVALVAKWRRLHPATHRDFHRCADELAAALASRAAAPSLADAEVVSVDERGHAILAPPQERPTPAAEGQE